MTPLKDEPLREEIESLKGQWRAVMSSCVEAAYAGGVPLRLRIQERKVVSKLVGLLLKENAALKDALRKDGRGKEDGRAGFADRAGHEQSRPAAVSTPEGVAITSRSSEPDWFRLFGEAMDALDECAGDDEEGWDRQQHAEKAAACLRAKYGGCGSLSAAEREVGH